MTEKVIPVLHYPYRLLRESHSKNQNPRACSLPSVSPSSCRCFRPSLHVELSRITLPGLGDFCRLNHKLTLHRTTSLQSEPLLPYKVSIHLHAQLRSVEWVIRDGTLNPLSSTRHSTSSRSAFELCPFYRPKQLDWTLWSATYEAAFAVVTHIINNGVPGHGVSGLSRNLV